MRVLFLCTGNSARSIMAEAILNARAGGRAVAESAGSHPAGAVNPYALRLLEREGLDTGALRSKSWDEFAAGPRFDVVVTVCDAAAGSCPVWPGSPVSAHWGIPDPAGAGEAAFSRAYRQLGERIDAFLELDFESLPQATLRSALQAIGRRAAS